MLLEDWTGLAAEVLEATGVLIITVGIFVVIGVLTARRLIGRSRPDYRAYRHSIGRVILLGLEILVAADIIRSVGVTPTFQSVGILALIVVVRTFLSFSLEVELEGRWPWQREPSSTSR